VTFDIATASDSATSGVDFVAKALTGQTIPQGATTYSFEVVVNGDTDLEMNETFLINLSNVSAGFAIGDGQGQGTITNDDIFITSIGAIQGSGELSPHDSQFVMTEGVVTAKRGNGYFLQSFGSEGAASPDGDIATSDGIFVFTGAAPDMVAVGDLARVAGTVDEFLGTAATPTTELVSPSTEVLDSGITLPAPVELTAAMVGPDSLPDTLEHLEGMLASVAAGVVTAQTGGFINEPNATSGDSNTAFEFVVAGVPRPLREPGLSILDPFPVPPAKEATIPYFDANQERIKAFPLVGTRLLADAGATVTGLVGPLTYFGDSWELLYDVAHPPVIDSAAAMAVSDAGANDITVGGFNLERFFDDTNDPSIGEPVLTSIAFANRLAKTGAAICAWVKTPDILGVVEVENLDTLTQLANYINGNCASAPVYAPYLQEGNDVGGIDVGFLVSNRAVRAGVSRVTVNSVTQMGKTSEYGTSPLGCTPGALGCTSSPLNDRPSLVMRASVNFSTGRMYPLTVIVNHLRSLNGNDDPADSRVRYKRAEQAVELANVVNNIQTGNPNEKVVLVGDFNAFPFNDGYVDVMGIITGHPAQENQVIEYRASPVATPLVLGDELIADPAQRYSYVFEGNAQSLDHAVVNEALVNDPSVVGLTVEHARINADFRVGHYGEFNLPYTAENPPLRVSDHDPVRLKIQLAEVNSADLSLSFSAPQPGGRGVSYSDTLTLHNDGPQAAIVTHLHLYLQTTDFTVMTVVAPSGWYCRSSTPRYSYDCTTSAPFASGS
ncbi:MAG: endonuclease/exonuclease/phosphatase family protein, partial [Thermomonas sp.]